MSTYSWSYKTAIHRKVSAKPAKTEQEDSEENVVSQNEIGSVVSLISNNDTASTVVPKRRKGNESILCKLCYCFMFIYKVIYIPHQL